MSHRNTGKYQTGFTLVELMVSITLIAVIGTTFLVFFKSNLFNYLNLQKDGTTFTQLAAQSSRMATVLRGTTGITSVANNDLVIYSYFYPSDNYVSLLHYYLQTANGVTQLKADLTPMSADPPNGTPLTAQKRTFTIIDNYYQASGVNLFTYLDASGNPLTVPISDLQTVKGIKVQLSAKRATSGANDSVNVQVSLRNRKTNL